MIRNFVWDDYPAVVRLWNEVGSGVVPEEEIRGASQHGPDLFLVAEVAAAGIVGVVLGTFDGRRGWIHRLAVHPNQRRAGLATELVGLVEKRLVAHGAPRINLLVLPDNSEALQFWQRRGYIAHPDTLCTKDTASLGQSSEAHKDASG
jgi:ribosomal protein S18 acetylase RimI-like enzyme